MFDFWLSGLIHRLSVARNLEKIEKKVNVDIGQTTYLPLLTFVDIWTTTYLPLLVNVVCERPLRSAESIMRRKEFKEGNPSVPSSYIFYDYVVSSLGLFLPVAFKKH